MHTSGTATSATPPGDERPRGCTNFKLRQLTRVVTQHYDAEVSASGLKTSQFSLLSHVERLGPIRPVDLAARMQMDASTLSRNLQPLIEAGWVVAEAGPNARSRLLRITGSGLRKRQEAQGRWKQAQTGLNDRLGAERVLQLHRLIDDALALLAAQDATDAPGKPGTGG